MQNLRHGSALTVFDGRDPIFRQIADQIRQDVVEGNLLEEEQVMSTTQYATTYRINPATAAKAFSELVDEGVLYQRRGLGTFVTPGARERLLELRRQRYFTDVLQPALDEAARIGIPLEAIAAHLMTAGDVEPAHAVGAHPEEKA